MRRSSVIPQVWFGQRDKVCRTVPQWSALKWGRSKHLFRGFRFVIMRVALEFALVLPKVCTHVSVATVSAGVSNRTTPSLRYLSKVGCRVSSVTVGFSRWVGSAGVL